MSDGTESEVEHDNRDKYIVSLAELRYERGLSIGSLASAVEDHGVWGWDRFDRFVHFQGESPYTAKALDRLALECDPKHDPDEVGGFVDPETDPMYHYGWLPKDLPTFVTLAEGPQKSDGVPGGLLMIQRSLLAIMGGMLVALEGDDAQWRGSPDYEGSDAFASKLANYLRGIHGTQLRTLQKHFAAARKLLKDA